MAELLLRGAQTVGELRGRAARMEPIKDLTQLQPVLDSLLAKRLVIRLTPSGRGSVVTHGLYLEQEMEKVRREASAMHIDESSRDAPTTTAASRLAEDSLAEELRELRDEVAALRAELEATAGQLRQDIDALNQQLGN